MSIQLIQLLWIIIRTVVYIGIGHSNLKMDLGHGYINFLKLYSKRYSK